MSQKSDQTDVSEPTEVCERLDWDSTFFGRTIAKAKITHLTPETRDSIERWCAAHGIDCLYFLAEAGDSSTSKLLEEAGYRLMDVRVMLDRMLNPADIQGRFDQVRPATAADIPVLRTIAATCHKATRFHADGRFDQERCDELYATWIEKSCLGYADDVVVAERNGCPVGYVTVHLDSENSARIGLVGVAEPWRRFGIGRDLLRFAISRLANRSVQRLTVVTQGGNVPSQRLYQTLGFKTCDMSIWYHRWFA